MAHPAPALALGTGRCAARPEEGALAPTPGPEDLPGRHLIPASPLQPCAVSPGSCSLIHSFIHSLPNSPVPPMDPAPCSLLGPHSSGKPGQCGPGPVKEAQPVGGRSGKPAWRRWQLSWRDELWRARTQQLGL